MMKKMRDHMRSAIALLVLNGTFVVASCTNEDIDLNEIDTTIGVGANGFTLPASSTNEIKLADVLTLNEGDCVQTLPADSGAFKKGDYQFKKADKITAATPKVKQVSFGSPQVLDNNFSIDITDEMASAAKIIDLPIGQMKFPLQEKEIASFSFSGNGEPAVVRLNHASTEEVIKLDLNFARVNTVIKRANFVLVFPNFIEAELLRNKCTGFNDPEGMESLELVYDKQTGKNQLKLTNANLKYNKHVELSLTGLTNFSTTLPSSDNGDYLVVNPSTVRLNGHIKMSGEIDAHYLKSNIQQGTYAVNNYINFGQTINITSATGYFDPDINIDPSTVEIGGDIPDFLTDDKVMIDLANPTIKLQVKNNMDAKGNVKARMTAFYDDAKRDSAFIIVDGIVVNPHKGSLTESTTTTVVICREGTSGTRDGIQYIVKGNKNDKKQTGKATEKTDLGELLTRIPKSFKFYIDANTDQTYESSFDLYDPAREGDTSARGQGYKIDPNYEFVAPFDLNPGSTIVYNDTIDDWNKDLRKNEIELYEGKVYATANIYNGTPLTLEMTPTAIGVDKKPLANVKVNVIGGTNNTLTVPSNFNMPVGSGKTPIQLEIVRYEGGSFKDLDGLLFSVVATSSTRGTLNSETQKIVIDDIKIKIDGKVSINLDSKDDD